MLCTCTEAGKSSDFVKCFVALCQHVLYHTSVIAIQTAVHFEKVNFMFTTAVLYYTYTTIRYFYHYDNAISDENTIFLLLIDHMFIMLLNLVPK